MATKTQAIAAAKQRVLKFRAWDNAAKEWLLGYHTGTLGGFSMFGETMLLGEWEAILSRFILHQADRSHTDLIVEQFTGLFDKNGAEIYEGDIVNRLHGDGYGVVAWDQGTCSFDIVNGGSSEHLFDTTGIGDLGRNHWEVIGNIHQHPELLK